MEVHGVWSYEGSICMMTPQKEARLALVLMVASILLFPLAMMFDVCATIWVFLYPFGFASAFYWAAKLQGIRP